MLDRFGLRSWWPNSSGGKESACNAGDPGSIPGLRRSPGEGNSYPLQYSGLENSMDYIVHGVAKSRTQLSDFHFSLSNVITLSESWFGTWELEAILFIFFFFVADIRCFLSCNNCFKLCGYSNDQTDKNTALKELIFCIHIEGLWRLNEASCKFPSSEHTHDSCSMDAGSLLPHVNRCFLSLLKLIPLICLALWHYYFSSQWFPKQL